MKKYYCLIVIGNIEGVEKTLESLIDGTFMHKSLGKLFISTFESVHSIWEIEEILHRDKRSYFLTKMDGGNFTATVQDINIQNDLFLDYVTKMTDLSNSKNEPPKIEFIDANEIDDNIKDFLSSLKDNFSKRQPKKKKVVIEPPTLDEILDKISSDGYESLSDFEKECLKNYSKG